VLVCGAARADILAQSPATGDAAVGVGIICNTSQQAEQFVRLRSTGVEPERAMHPVNANAHDERVCGVAAIAYIRYAPVVVPGTKHIRATWYYSNWRDRCAYAGYYCLYA
jgi:hypothetical protein